MMQTGMSVTIVIHIHTVNVYKLVYMIHCSIGHIHCIVSPFKEKMFTAFKHSYGNQIVPGKKNILSGDCHFISLFFAVSFNIGVGVC